MVTLNLSSLSQLTLNHLPVAILALQSAVRHGGAIEALGLNDIPKGGHRFRREAAGLAILCARLHGLRGSRDFGLRMHQEHDNENGSGGQCNNTGHDRVDCSPE